MGTKKRVENKRREREIRETMADPKTCECKACECKTCTDCKDCSSCNDCCSDCCKQNRKQTHERNERTAAAEEERTQTNRVRVRVKNADTWRRSFFLSFFLRGGMCVRVMEKNNVMVKRSERKDGTRACEFTNERASREHNRCPVRRGCASAMLCELVAPRKTKGVTRTREGEYA